MEVAIVRLTSGEEILTEVISKDETTIKIKNPVRILVIPSKNDPETPQIALAPWLQFAAKKEFDLPRSFAPFDYVPVTEFINQYKQIHGGIITPPQRLILPS